jgi:arginine utilization protein RocB
MPGLRLRREQAQRLWALDKDACTELLEALVESKFLQRCADGSYARLSEGTVRQPVSMTNTPLAARPSARPLKKHSAA